MKIIEKGMNTIVLGRSPEDSGQAREVRGQWGWERCSASPLSTLARVVIQTDTMGKYVIMERKVLWPAWRRKRIRISDIDFIGTRYRSSEQHEGQKWYEGESLHNSPSYIPEDWEVYLVRHSGRPIQIAKGRDWGQVKAIINEISTLIGKRVEYNYR